MTVQRRINHSFFSSSLLDKEVALTQHDISVLQYQKEITELLGKGTKILSMPWMKGVGCCLFSNGG